MDHPVIIVAIFLWPIVDWINWISLYISILWILTITFLEFLGCFHTAAPEIWKRSFISTVRPRVHTTPSQKQSFFNTLFKPYEFENAGFAVSCEQKTSIL